MTDQYAWLDELLNKEMPGMTEKKKAVVKAAIFLFSEKGYAATSTKEIAVTAGVSEGTIFKHFESKNALMIAVIDLIINEMMMTMFYTGLSDILAAKYETLDDFLRALVRNRLSLMERAVPLFKILIQEIPFHEEIRIRIREKVTQIPVRELIEQLPIRGLGSSIPVDEVILTLVTCFGGFVQTRFIIMPEYFAQKPGYNREDDFIAMIHFVLRGFGIEPEQEKEETAWTSEKK